jgi:hypothetical protein
MSYVDLRPTARSEVGGAGEIRVRVGGASWIGASAYLGGGWFEFIGEETSGRIEDAVWLVRCGPQIRLRGGQGSSVWLGAGLEYGESSSSLKVFDDSFEGPRGYPSGVYMKLGVESVVAHRASAFAEGELSVFRTRAREVPNKEYRWLGESVGLHAGIRLLLF